MERQPVKTIPIHEHLRPRLCDTYENDSIFDKFEVVFSGDAKNVMTGSYNNNFMIYPSEVGKDTEVVLQADKSAFKAKKVGIPTPMNGAGGKDKKGNSRANSPAGQGARMRKETDADAIDFNKKILHMSWHPFEDSIAIAATNNVSTCACHYLWTTTNSRTALRLLGIVDDSTNIKAVSKMSRLIHEQSSGLASSGMGLHRCSSFLQAFLMLSLTCGAFVGCEL